MQLKKPGHLLPFFFFFFYPGGFQKEPVGWNDTGSSSIWSPSYSKTIKPDFFWKKGSIKKSFSLFSSGVILAARWGAIKNKKGKAVSHRKEQRMILFISSKLITFWCDTGSFVHSLTLFHPFTSAVMRGKQRRPMTDWTVGFDNRQNKTESIALRYSFKKKTPT